MRALFFNMPFIMNTNTLNIAEKASVSILKWFGVKFAIFFFVILVGIFLPDNFAGYVLLKNLISLGGIVYILKEIRYTRQIAVETCQKYLLGIRKSLVISIKYLASLFALLLVLTLIFILFLKLFGLENYFEIFIDNSMASKKDSLTLLKAGLFSCKGGFWLYAISISALTPIVEEILYRRFFYVSLRKKLAFPAAAVLNSAIFGIFHFPELITGFLAGIFLCYVYEKEGNLLVNVLIHAIKNFLAILLLIYMK